MKRMLLMAAAGALLAGCDYTVPLVKTANLPIDPAVVGLWQRTGGDNKVERLLVLPLSRQEYLVVFPAGSEDALYARGCLWRGGSTTLVQLDWFGTARGGLPDDTRTFQYASYRVESGTLTCRLLNPDVVPRELASSDALAKAIADSQDNPTRYRDGMVFQKVQH